MLCVYDEKVALLTKQVIICEITWMPHVCTQFTSATMSITSLAATLVVLERHPVLMKELSFQALIQFVQITSHLIPHISWLSGTPRLPLILPGGIPDFLSATLKVKESVISECWTAFGEMIWSEDNTLENGYGLSPYIASAGLYGTFLEYGLPRGIGEFIHIVIRITIIDILMLY